jgi:hypothetical protein
MKRYWNNDVAGGYDRYVTALPDFGRCPVKSIFRTMSAQCEYSSHAPVTIGLQMGYNNIIKRINNKYPGSISDWKNAFSSFRFITKAIGSDTSPNSIADHAPNSRRPINENI